MEANLPIEPKRTSFFKRLLKFIFLSLLLILILILSLVLVVFSYEKEIKAIVIKELNKHLNAEVKVDPSNIEITIIKSFPNCALEFKNLLMLEALKAKKRDTLLFAGQLDLYFNVKDIWNKKYDIKKLKLKEGLINLSVLKDGGVNYEFWKANEDKQGGKSSDSLSFKLNSITIEKCRFRYKDKQLFFKTELAIKRLELMGSFSEEKYELKMKGAAFANYVTKGKIHYLKEKDCSFDLDFQVEGNNYEINKADIKVNRLGLELKGRLTYSDSLEKVKLEYTAPGMDISSFLSLLPDKLKENINEYSSDGSFYAKGSFDYSADKRFQFISHFGVKHAEVTFIPNSTKADQVNLDGYLKWTERSSVIDLKNVYLKLYNDEIKGQCTITDFNHPHLKLTASAKVNLENVFSFFPIDTVTQLSGKLNIDAEVEGSISDLKNNAFGNTVKLAINANVDSLKIQFKRDEKIFSLQSCSLTAVDREAVVKNCKLLRGSSDVLVNGKIPGLFNYLTDRTAPLKIIGELNSDNIKLEDFMMNYYSSDKDAPLIPANMLFDLKATIAHFSYSNFKADEITGDIEVKNQKAIVNDVKLKTMEGEAEINAFFDNSKNKLDIVLQSKLSNINISQLFYQFNNFGQSTLIDKNLKGYASAQLDLSGRWSNALDADYSSIKSSCDLSIERGELIDFKPMLSLAKFVDVKDLQHIRFSKLQGKVEIANQWISIPKTSIKNSAMNIEFWGRHSFNNDIDYHIQLLISELLAKRRKTKDNEFGEVENDPENRRSAFILMTGTVDVPIIKYDKKGLKDKIKNDLKEEKQNIKQLLKEEFGLFKKDTLIKKKPVVETKFELEKPNNKPVKKPLEPKKKEEDDDDF